MALNYLNNDIRKSLIGAIDSNENKERKNLSLAQYEIFKDRILPYVKKYLEGFYSKDTVKEMPIVASVNLARRIVMQEASIYKQEPKRRFVGVTDAQAEIIETVYSEMKLNTAMRKANEFFKLQEQTHLQILPSLGKLKARVLLPHQLDAVPSSIDPEIAEAYIVNGFDRSAYAPKLTEREDGQNQIIGDVDDYKATLSRLALWSREYNFVMDKNGNIVSGDQVENPIGPIIPFIDINGGKDGEFWQRSGAALTDFTIQLNGSFSDLGHVVRMQGFGQAWLKGPENMIPQNLQIGPAFVIKLPIDSQNPVQTDFGFATPNPDLAGSISYVEMLLSSFLTSRGLDPKLVNGKGQGVNFTSGFERLLSMIENFEPSRSDFDVFRDAENRAFNIIRAYLNTYGGTDVLPDYRVGTISDDAYVEVEFKKPELVQTEQERLSSVQQKLDLGVISGVEAIMEARNITREEALIVAREIQNPVIE